MVRGALAALLELEPDMIVVASIDRGDTIVQTARDCRPDVAIIDIDLPGLDGLSAAELLHLELPECRTLILTSLGRPGTLRRALNARVSGFLLKDSPAERLAQAVREVMSGRRVVDSELALAAWDSVDNPLSQREMDVLRQAATGSDAAEIAATLHLSIGTVRNYLSVIVSKLDARNRVDAIRIADEAGWLP